MSPLEQNLDPHLQNFSPFFFLTLKLFSHMVYYDLVLLPSNVMIKKKRSSRIYTHLSNVLLATALSRESSGKVASFEVVLCRTLSNSDLVTLSLLFRLKLVLQSCYPSHKIVHFFSKFMLKKSRLFIVLQFLSENLC
jgi:hypothetical protein